MDFACDSKCLSLSLSLSVFLSLSFSLVPLIDHLQNNYASSEAARCIGHKRGPLECRTIKMHYENIMLGCGHSTLGRQSSKDVKGQGSKGASDAQLDIAGACGPVTMLIEDFTDGSHSSLRCLFINLVGLLHILSSHGPCAQRLASLWHLIVFTLASVRARSFSIKCRDKLRN